MDEIESEVIIGDIDEDWETPLNYSMILANDIGPTMKITASNCNDR